MSECAAQRGQTLVDTGHTEIGCDKPYVLQAMSPRWHSQLLQPAQLTQGGFFSSITMYYDNCYSKKIKKKKKKQHAHPNSEHAGCWRSAAPAQGAYTRTLTSDTAWPAQCADGDLRSASQHPRRSELFARQAMNSMFQHCTSCISKQEGFCPLPLLQGGCCRAGGTRLAPGSCCGAEVFLWARETGQEASSPCKAGGHDPGSFGI